MHPEILERLNSIERVASGLHLR